MGLLLLFYLIFKCWRTIYTSLLHFFFRKYWKIFYYAILLTISFFSTLNIIKIGYKHEKLSLLAQIYGAESFAHLNIHYIRTEPFCHNRGRDKVSFHRYCTGFSRFLGLWWSVLYENVHHFSTLSKADWYGRNECSRGIFPNSWTLLKRDSAGYIVLYGSLLINMMSETILSFWNNKFF